MAKGAGLIVLCAVGSTMGQPLVTSTSWFAWYQTLLNQRLNACPLQRAATYYFSQSGSDAGDGSVGTPWRSLAKAQAFLNANPQGAGCPVVQAR